MDPITTALAALGGLIKAINLITTWLDTAKANGEMTRDQESQYDAYTAERMNLPHWQRRQ